MYETSGAQDPHETSIKQDYNKISNEKVILKHYGYETVRENT